MFTMSSFASDGSDLNPFGFTAEVQHYALNSAVSTMQITTASNCTQLLQPSAHVKMEGSSVLVGGEATQNQQDPLLESGSMGQRRKKKKKRKSSEDSPTGGFKMERIEDEALLTEPLGLDDLLFSGMPPSSGSGGTIIAGQYLLNNSVLEQVLAQKKMKLLQSPEVLEFVQKKLAKG
ncbi:uncharacterized protein LOC143034368 [Oratosquilla oratoria]|uniref:uncharacterized protein LOC143034368 n=1 Tax=Oratosquilla oratoria TaxID=337810 RepID=UPI003F75F335